MILYMNPFAPWRLWPIDHYRTQRDDGNWHVYHWLFFTIDIRRKAVGGV